MDNSNTVRLRNNKQKMKTKILEDNKSVKSEQNIDPPYKVNELRRDLNLEASKVFKKGTSEINIDDEDNLTVADIQLEGKINIIEKSLNYSIFINNSPVLSESYSPVITEADLRTYLLMYTPKECIFINVIKQTHIPQELEDTIQINKISDNSNNMIKSKRYIQYQILKMI